MTAKTKTQKKIKARPNAKDIQREVGGLFRTRRQALGMTQGDVASKAGYTRTSIVNFELGHQNVGLRQMSRLAEALDSSLLVMLEEQGGVVSAADAAVWVENDRLCGEVKELRRKVQAARRVLGAA